METLIEMEEIDNLEQPSSSIRNSKNDNNKERRISTPMYYFNDRPNEEDTVSIASVSTKTNKCSEESDDTDKSLTSNFNIHQVRIYRRYEQWIELHCYTPLKDKEYTNCLKIGEFLIRYFDEKIYNHTKYLLKKMQETDIVPEIIKVNSRLRNRMYIWACHHSFLDILHKLEELGVDINYIDPCTGMNAVLAASLSGNISCLEHLIGKGVDVNSRNPKNHYTPLHFAAIAKSREKTALLLNNGANFYTFSSDKIEPVIHCAIIARAIDVLAVLLSRDAKIYEKNQLNLTSLHVACFLHFVPCVDLMLSITRYGINNVDDKGRTPLHLAVATGDCPAKLVKLLINNGALINVADIFGDTPLHIAALQKNSDCAKTLIWAGADVGATNRSGISALNMLLRRIPESLQVLRKRLDVSIRTSRRVPPNRESGMEFNFDPLFPSDDRCETSLIDIFVKENQKDLLLHPLVMAYLHVKWKKIRKFCWSKFFIYTIKVILLTTYVLTALSYKCYNHYDFSSSKICNSTRISGFLFRRPVIKIEWYLCLVLTCVTLARKIFGFMVYKSVKQYFFNIDNVLDGIVIVSVFVTSFVYTGKTYEWQNYVGAFAILCAWTRVMLMVGKFNDFGTYIAMFTHIQFEFAKLLLAYSGLLIGFTVSFCAICVGEPAFGNIFTGFIKVLGMMTGELDFESFINEKDEDDDGPFVLNHPLSVCAQILLALFIFFVTVILMNLLVGIAVYDISDLRNQSRLTKLIRQIELILSFENLFHPKGILYFTRKWLGGDKIFMKSSENVLVVKPLDPSEKCLPNVILKAALEIAQNNIQYMNDNIINYNDYSSWMKQKSDQSSETRLKYAIKKLSTKFKANKKTIKLIKNQLLHTNNMLENIGTRLASDKSI